ncbi:MAG: hypothetical protein MK142_02865, partial [Pseudomonadales bacterium]|nr:hypothetical protein [Pseudomonadales bacterium]
TQTVRVISDALVTFRRGEGAAAVFVIVNVSDMIRTLDAELRRDLGIEGVQAELLGETRLEAGQSLRIEPYAALWLKAAQD